MHRNARYLVAAACIAIILLLNIAFRAYFAQLSPAYFGGDFINMWVGSQIVRTVPDFVPVLMDAQAYMDYLLVHIGPKALPHNWSYSPLMVLLVWPLSLLEYYPALILWVGLGIGWYIYEARFYLIRPGRIWVVMLCPAMLTAVGQNGFFTAALLLGAWRHRHTSPVRAGFYIALLTVKPHLYLLLPLALVATRAWKTIGATMLWITILVLITVWAFGMDMWYAYFTKVAPYQMTVLETWGGGLRWMMPSVFNASFLFSENLRFSYALQAVAGVTIALHYGLTQWRSPRYRDNPEFFLFATFMLTPYLFTYDLMVLMPFLVNRMMMPPDRKEQPLLAWALYVLPCTWHLVMGVKLLSPMQGNICVALWVGCFYAYYGFYFVTEKWRNSATSAA